MCVCVLIRTVTLLPLLVRAWFLRPKYGVRNISI